MGATCRKASGLFQNARTCFERPFPAVEFIQSCYYTLASRRARHDPPAYSAQDVSDRTLRREGHADSHFPSSSTINANCYDIASSSFISLAIGSPLSALSTFQAKVASINAKHGPFDACVVVGDLFKEGSDGSELEGIARKLRERRGADHQYRYLLTLLLARTHCLMW